MEIQASDGVHTDALSVKVTVREVNEGPEISGQQTFSFSENQTTSRFLATYTATDPEDPSAIITRWSLTGSDAGDFTITENGQLTFRQAPDYESPADSGRDNVYNFSVRASDGRHYGYLPVTVSITDVNEPPTITTISTSATELRQDENRIARLYTYRATDPEGGTVTWSVGGVDESHFAIDARGEFAFRATSPPNFEQPGDVDGDNVYAVEIQASDGAHTYALSVRVTVREVNEGPEISRIGSPPGSVPENQDQTQVLALYTATDPEGGAVSRWRTSGIDGGDFVINEQGELRFRAVPDYDRPADANRDNTYVFRVEVSDGRYYGSFDETVTVTEINEHDPVIRSSSRTSFTYREEDTSALYTYSAVDGDRGERRDQIGARGRRRRPPLRDSTDRNASSRIQ